MARWDYVQLARTAITEMLDQHHAVVWPEVEARAADVAWASNPVPVNPHWLTTARQRLVADMYCETEAKALKAIEKLRRANRAEFSDDDLTQLKAAAALLERLAEKL